MKIPVFAVPNDDFLNQKALHKIHEVPETHVPVLSVFSTLEGEGLYLGTPRVLARVSGCAIMCSGCDTKYSWNPKGTKDTPAALMTIKDFVNKIADTAEAAKTREVSITGGEPMHYPKQLRRIIHLLSAMGYRVSIETSGMIIDSDLFRTAYSVSLDIKTPSSGVVLSQENIDALIATAFLHKEVQLKAVIDDQNDLDFVASHFSTILNAPERSRVSPLVLTPCADNTLEPVSFPNISRIMDMCIRWNNNYHVRIVPQIHKLLGFD